MSKTLFIFTLPDVKIRKKYAPPEKIHNGIRYSRKIKHKGESEEKTEKNLDFSK